MTEYFIYLHRRMLPTLQQLNPQPNHLSDTHLTEAPKLAHVREFLHEETVIFASYLTYLILSDLVKTIYTVACIFSV